MTARWRAVQESVRSGFWAVPTGCVLLAVLLAIGLVQLDRGVEDGFSYTFGAGPDGAREVLSAITTAMITFTGLVFSITVVVLVLTSSQFSPRVLRTFLRDRETQGALGVFVATFVYAVLVLRTVDSGEDTRFVPAIATTVGLVLLLVSTAMFVAYINHIATSIQISSIIASISKETRQALERRFPSGTDSPADAGPVQPPDDLPSAVVPATSSGVVTTVDEHALVERAARAGVVLRTGVRVGDFVPEGAPLFEVLGDPHDLDLAGVTDSVGQGRTRTMQQDVAFGFRQLVDIAEKALSPGVNDPTTAVQALDALHDLLRRLATRPLRSGVHLDDDGAVRLVVPPDRLADYLALALDEVEQYGEDTLQVNRRVDLLLGDLAAAALPQHRDAVEARRSQRAGARSRYLSR
jgi:uncharacterized membrane protein